MAVPVVLESVRKHFGAVAAVDGVSLDIRPGELFFLLGPSGCGKTTLLRTIAGFYAPDAGSVRIGDRDITRLPPHRRDTGMVFQSYALWPHMTVAENVAFGLKMRKLAKADIRRRVDEALALVKMEDRAQYKPNQLSGGQQQRVALARALVIHPQCLLLDEPLSNLDAKLRLEMRVEIRRICKEAGLTAIYVTHDQKEALSIADRMAVMRAGRVCRIGTPMDVYRSPENIFTARFIGETNFLSGEVTAAHNGRLTIRTAPGEWTAAAPGGPFAEGARVCVSLRPETLRLGRPPPDAPNVFGGRVHHTVYLGETAQHQLTLDDGTELKVFELNPRIVARDRAEPVRAWIDPADVTVLNDEPGER